MNEKEILKLIQEAQKEYRKFEERKDELRTEYINWQGRSATHTNYDKYSEEGEALKLSFREANLMLNRYEVDIYYLEKDLANLKNKICGDCKTPLIIYNYGGLISLVCDTCSNEYDNEY